MAEKENNNKNIFMNVKSNNDAVQPVEKMDVENFSENNNEMENDEMVQSSLQENIQTDDQLKGVTLSEDDEDDWDDIDDDDDDDDEIDYLNNSHINSSDIDFNSPNESDMNNIDDERTFREIFENKFGTEHPQFFSGSFFEAVEQANQRSTFLVAYTDQKNFPDFRYKQHFLTHSRIIEYFDGRNAVLWASLSSSDESKQFREIFNVRSEIFCGIYMANNQSEMVLVKDIFLLDDPETILLDIMEGEREHLNKMNHMRQMEQLRLERQQVIAEQDRAYEESLRIDKAKSERKLAEKTAQEALRKAKEEAQNLIRLKKEEARQNLVPEPNGNNNTSDTVTLAFRFASGTKMTRKFLVSHTLADLHYFVLTQSEINCANVELKTNFPTKVLPFDTTICIGESSLRDRDLIFVYSLN